MDKDNLVLKRSSAKQDSPEEVFYDKKYIYQTDQNSSSDYSTNQVEFNTATWVSSGAMMDLREATVVIPLCFELETNKNLKDDPVDLKLKSNNINIINSAMFEYNNDTVVQGSPEVTPYLQFLSSSTGDVNDESLLDYTGVRNTHLKDWEYDPHYGVSITDLSFYTIKTPFYTGDKDAVYGQQKGINKVIKVSSDPNDINSPQHKHFYYYNCYIRLKDFPFFDSMPMTRGANVKMIFTLNQLEMTFTRGSGATFSQSTIKKGSSCPFLLNKNQILDLLAAQDDYLKVTCSVAKPPSGDAYKHDLTRCRLYAPAYTLSPMQKTKLTDNPVRHLVFNDVSFNHIRDVPASNDFNFLINNTITRVKRLIIVPFLKNNGAMGWNSLMSPFTEDGLSHPCPINITNFNVSISGLNVYSTQKQYKFEQWLDEGSHQYGVEAGLENGQVSGLNGGLFDYENNQGYLVVDLSRKSPDDETEPVSIEITGTNNSPLALEFLCYMEIEKDFKINVLTSERI